MPKGISKRIEQRRAVKAATMPEVKKLVKRFGRAAISACLAKLREHERGLSKLAALKGEVAKLERAL
jgi:hypothetical protein